jgi:(5-formylfuran-3-yl)methyl phosphate synthase
MPGLLVSVRSADEALAAVAGGASVIDVKEPDRGPLGRADAAVWRAVRAVVPPRVPVSVALGELAEWRPAGPVPRPPFDGIAYRKVGLAESGPGWSAAWRGLRRAWGAGPAWIAVAYVDWRRARAPDPGAVLDAALECDDCAGVLVDSWDKAGGDRVDASWRPWIERARAGGRRVALAGGLDADAIARLAPLGPDLFAVRGAACRRGDRRDAIDPGRVAALVRAATGP